MKKKYIKPYLETVAMASSDTLLTASPLKISDTEVSEGMVKGAGDWGDIWGPDEE